MQFSSPDFTAGDMIAGKYFCDPSEQRWQWILDRNFGSTLNVYAWLHMQHKLDLFCFFFVLQFTQRDTLTIFLEEN